MLFGQRLVVVSFLFKDSNFKRSLFWDVDQLRKRADVIAPLLAILKKDPQQLTPEQAAFHFVIPTVLFPRTLLLGLGFHFSKVKSRSYLRTSAHVIVHSGKATSSSCPLALCTYMSPTLSIFIAIPMLLCSQISLPIAFLNFAPRTFALYFDPVVYLIVCLLAFLCSSLYFCDNSLTFSAPF